MRKILLLALLLVANAAHADAVNLSWDPILDPAVKSIKLYQASSCTAAKPWTLVATSTTAIPPLPINNLYSGTYCWYATASNGTLESAPSNTVTVTIPLAPPVIRIQ